MNRHRLHLLFAALCAAGLSCSTLNAGGDVTDTGNAAVASVIVNSDGTRAVYAKVLLRPVDYLADSLHGERDRARIRDTYTDTSGAFVIDSLDTGEYFIEVDNGRYEAVLIHYENRDPGAFDRLGTHTLEPAATFKGSIDPAMLTGADAVVRVRGLERRINVDPVSGEYTITVPAGSYYLSISAGSQPAYQIESVTAGAGEISHVEGGGVRFRSRPLFLNTTESGAPISEDVYNFPLLVRLDQSTFPFGTTTSGGKGVRFTKLDGVPLNHEIEFWDETGAQAVIWVRMDTVRANSEFQSITMSWGDSTVPGFSSGPDVFSPANGFAGVWHLDSEADDTGSMDVYRNSAGVSAHGTDLVSCTGKLGVIGKGQQFDGVDDYIDCGNDPAFTLIDEFVVSAWVKLANPDTNRYHRIISKKEPWYGSEGYELELNPSLRDEGELTFVGADSTLLRVSLDWDTAWHHCAAVISGGAVTFYFDGQKHLPYSLGEKWPLVAGDQHLLIGGIGDNDYFAGWMDEVRVEAVARSASWLRLCYENQRPNQRLVRLR